MNPKHDQLIAFSEQQAAKLADVSVQRLRAWAERELVWPSIVRRLSPRNTVRLYGFTDLEAVLIVRELQRRGISIQHIAKIVREHRKKHDRPLNALRFDVRDGRLFILHPDGGWDEERQGVFEQILHLEPIRARIREAVSQSRSSSEIGRVESRRKVLGSTPVFAGTRVPVATVHECLAYVLSVGPSLEGIWAGTSKRERQHLGKIISSGAA